MANRGFLAKARLAPLEKRAQMLTTGVPLTRVSGVPRGKKRTRWLFASGVWMEISAARVLAFTGLVSMSGPALAFLSSCEGIKP